MPSAPIYVRNKCEWSVSLGGFLTYTFPEHDHTSFPPAQYLHTTVLSRFGEVLFEVKYIQTKSVYPNCRESKKFG